MSSDKKCCVPGCFEARGASHLALHLFPNPDKDPERFEAWRLAVGGLILELPNDHVYKYRRVCHAHFEEKFHCRYNRLSNIAIPKLNLADVYKMDIEQCKENKPDPEPIPSYISKPRNRPMSSIENFTNCLPSTSKFSSEELNTRIKPIHQDIQPAIDLKRMKKTVKVQAKSLAEKCLYKKLVTAKMKLSKYKNKVKKQAAALKMSKNIMKNPSTLKVLERLPRSAKILTILQLREVKKKSKGRRFTYNEKILALSMLKQSPKAYRFLRKIFILPAPQTLIKLITRANIQTGINKNIFSQMKKQVEKMKPSDKLCVLLFDEMALKSNITYNERLDKVIGFVDNGEEITKEFADHAQVFMIRGLIKNYKQPIGYTFSASATKGPELAKQIKLYIKELTKAGLIVLATICDQGSGNRNAIKCLIDESRATWLRRGEEPRNNIILVDDLEIVPLYDTPHLIKCVRNNLMVTDLKYVKENKTRIAKWSHIECLYDECPAYQGIRLVPKLTEMHVKPAKISKMKVKYATQLFSQTVATNMGYLADKQVIPEECKETADILLFFDCLFDSMNGSFNKKYRHAKPALGPVTPNSIHHKIWQESKNMLKNMQFIKDNKTKCVPTLNNWVWTLDGMETLLKILNKKYAVSSVWTRHMNQDPIENFFGSIRSHGCRNTNPTPERFQSAFASLLINSLSNVHAPGNNCEDDVASSLYALIINEDCNANSVAISLNYDMLQEINFTNIEQKFENTRIKAALEYCSGYFARKAKNKIFKICTICQETFIDINESEYISYREFQKKRWLCSPKMEFIINISQLQDIIYYVLLNNVEKRNIKELIKTLVLMYIDFSYIKCETHKENLIIFITSNVTRFFIHTYCKNINKILCGKRDNDDAQDLLQLKAKKYFDKTCKRKK